MRRIVWAIALVWMSVCAWAQGDASSWNLPQAHPRYLTSPQGREEVLRLVKQEDWAKDVFDELKQRTDVYVCRTDTQPDWLYSRLAMYWESHATDVYVKGESFDHAGGKKAPVPTVRYTGTRGTATNYRRPRLEDIIPYDDDEAGNVTFHNKTLPGEPLEKVHPSKTGRNIESLNREIMGIARDAAFLYWVTQEERYARLAAGVFDTYMTGMYYRHVPIDLNHGHQQTLVGMSSFEVIHEDILNEIVPLYDFLFDYLQTNYADRMELYAAAFKKWADNIIDNGVPHNNWNLMQARYIMNIGMVLEDNQHYADGKGRGYYIDYVLNRSSIRQWSLKKLADYGYDLQTGIWAECPGYSAVVLNDYTGFTTLFDRNLGFDLTQELPVIPRAVAAMPQYLFPNRMVCGFGDTHPAPLSTTPVKRMIQNAQANGKPEQEKYFTALLKCLDPSAGEAEASKRVPVAVTSFFEDKPLSLSGGDNATAIESYVSSFFHAPNVSWLVQRNGMDARHSLMVSLNGSLGNHMHANGISMELYGKGYVLGPDAGIGQNLYSGLDYAEYYSQFPSHNTVCVDGVSSYPVMKSHHAFELLSGYPGQVEPGSGFPQVTYSEVYFREPETQADQTRLNSIVTLGEKGGYYVDIFRSRKVKGGDKMHDYFYHNLGQSMTLTASDGSDLDLQPTEELAFAGAHLYAYSYLFNKKSARTARDVKAVFTMKMAGGDDIAMNLWMKGEADREVFTALSPMTEGLSRIKNMPYSIKDQPTLTFVARQDGEAWSRPFVAIYEPSSVHEPELIQSVTFPEVASEGEGSQVAISIQLKDGRHDLILSSDRADGVCEAAGLSAKASYALWRRSADGKDELFFLGNGTQMHTSDVSLQAACPVSVLIEHKADGWYYDASGTCTLIYKGRTYHLEKGKYQYLF